VVFDSLFATAILAQSQRQEAAGPLQQSKHKFATVSCRAVLCCAVLIYLVTCQVKIDNQLQEEAGRVTVVGDDDQVRPADAAHRKCAEQYCCQHIEADCVKILQQ
jgi:hypothetical protein